MAELNLARARELVDAAIAKAEEIGVPITAAVVDAGAHVIVKARMDGCNLLALAVAEDKAYTAAGIGISTGDLAGLAGPGQPLFGVSSLLAGRVIAFGGGFPLRSGGRLVGGFGVSGGSVDQDVEIAEGALEVWAE